MDTTNTNAEVIAKYYLDDRRQLCGVLRKIKSDIRTENSTIEALIHTCTFLRSTIHNDEYAGL